MISAAVAVTELNFLFSSEENNITKYLGFF